MVGRLLAVAVGVTLLVAGCGDDDDEATDEYCEVARELSESDDFGAEQLDRYVEVAPDEIADEAELAAEAIQERGDAAFEDPDVVDAVEDIEAFELAECGITSDDDGDDGGDDGVPPADDGTTDDTTDDGTTDDDTTDDDTTDDDTTGGEATTTTVAATSTSAVTTTP